MRIVDPGSSLTMSTELVHEAYDVLAPWRGWAGDVRGHAIDATHFVSEDAPSAVLGALQDFLV